ncbi:MAG: hypothetical protein ACRDD7_12765 [Peptostreptococcaceae bacterium]
MALMTFNSYKAQTVELLEKGIVNTMARTSDLIAELPIEVVNGLLYKYNTSDYDEQLEFKGAGEEFSADAVESTPVILELKHMGVYCDVPMQYVKGGNISDLRANTTEVKTENFAKNLEKNIFYADGKGLAFKGFDQFITEGIGTKVEGQLTYDLLCEAIDVVPGANKIFCNRKTLRAIEKMLKTEGYRLGDITLDGGKVVKDFGGIQIFSTETIKDNELFVMEFSTKGCGLLALQSPITVTDLGLMETRPIFRTMIDGSYAPIARQKSALSKLTITSAKTVAKSK